MQKKIIVLAIAAAMSVPALAFAEVTISGQANASIDMINDGAATNAASANVLKSNQSRVVLKGSDDLGGGLSAMYSIDHRFNLDDGVASTPFWGGNAFVGLKSNDMGTVMVGRLDTPYKTSTRNLDVFFDVAGDSRGALGGLMSAHDARVNNALAYASPSMGGFSVTAATVFGGETPVANSTKGDALSLAATYSKDAIYATLAYQNIKAGTAGTGDLATNGALGTAFALGAVGDKVSALKVGGGYKMDAITVNAVIEMPSDTTAAGVETKNTNLYVGAKFGISSTDAVRAAFTNRGASKTGSVTNADKATQIAIGYSHDMSKATSVYATYVKTTAEGTLADPSNLSFGMKHAF